MSLTFVCLANSLPAIRCVLFPARFRGGGEADAEGATPFFFERDGARTERTSVPGEASFSPPDLLTCK